VWLRVSEITALGAAYLAGLAAGFWKDIGELQAQWPLERRFSPAMAPHEVKRSLAGWRRAVGAAKAWADQGAPNPNNPLQTMQTTEENNHAS
jgi:glycerol kinase